MADEQNLAAEPITSSFADDPDMAEIVEMFVNELPDRVAALESAWTGQQLEEVTRIAHQLKGASGGYGFDSIGNSAGRLETSLRALSSGSTGVCLDSIKSEFRDLVSMLKRVRG